MSLVVPIGHEKISWRDFCRDPTVDLCVMHLGMNLFHERDGEGQILVYSLPSCNKLCCLPSV